MSPSPGVIHRLHKCFLNSHVHVDPPWNPLKRSFSALGPEWGLMSFRIAVNLPGEDEAVGLRPHFEQPGPVNLQDPGHQSQRAWEDPLVLFSLEQGVFSSEETFHCP